MSDEVMDLEVRTLAGICLGSTTCALDSEVGDLRALVQSWLREGARGDGMLEDSEISLLTGSMLLEEGRLMREYCTYTGDTLVVTAVVGRGTDIIVKCRDDNVLMCVSSCTTAGRLKEQLADDLDFDPAMARLSLLVKNSWGQPLEDRGQPLEDKQLVLSPPYTSGMSFYITFL